MYSQGSHISFQLAETVFTILKEWNIPGAAYNSIDRQSASSCQKGTREEVVAEISKWADGGDDCTICWLHGPAGSGKSTIAHTIAKKYASRKRLAASFFFSRGNAERSDTTKFFSTLAYQLAVSDPSTRLPMREALQNNPSILSQTLEDQFENLILNHIRSYSSSMIVVIDGLDECEGEGSVALLKVLDHANLKRPLPIRFFLSSRTDDRIKQTFGSYLSRTRPLDLKDFGAHDDIRAYLRKSFSELYVQNRNIMKAVKPPWPLDSDLDKIVNKADGLFIYASTVVKFVGERPGKEKKECEPRLPHQKLRIAMERHNGLDPLYRQVLSDAPLSSNDLFRRIIGALLLLREPVSINKLAGLLRVDDAGELLAHLDGCGSVLNIPNDDAKTIRFFHASLQDFLTDVNCSRNYFIDAMEHHIFIFDDCVQIMTNKFTSSSDGGSGIEWALSYACRHWYYHMTYVVQGDVGIRRINSYFGARLMGFLVKIKHDWFRLWIDGTEYGYAIENLGNDVFALASIIKVVSVNLHSNNCHVYSRTNAETF